MPNHIIDDSRPLKLDFRKFEKKDLNHADTFNPIVEILLNNDNYLNKMSLELKNTIITMVKAHDTDIKELLKVHGTEIKDLLIKLLSDHDKKISDALGVHDKDIKDILNKLIITHSTDIAALTKLITDLKTLLGSSFDALNKNIISLNDKIDNMEKSIIKLISDGIASAVISLEVSELPMNIPFNTTAYLEVAGKMSAGSEKVNIVIKDYITNTTLGSGAETCRCKVDTSTSGIHQLKILASTASGKTNNRVLTYSVGEEPLKICDFDLTYEKTTVIKPNTLIDKNIYKGKIYAVPSVSCAGSDYCKVTWITAKGEYTEQLLFSENLGSKLTSTQAVDVSLSVDNITIIVVTYIKCYANNTKTYQVKQEDRVFSFNFMDGYTTLPLDLTTVNHIDKPIVKPDITFDSNDYCEITVTTVNLGLKQTLRRSLGAVLSFLNELNNNLIEDIEIGGQYIDIKVYIKGYVPASKRYSYVLKSCNFDLKLNKTTIIQPNSTIDQYASNGYYVVPNCVYDSADTYIVDWKTKKGNTYTTQHSFSDFMNCRNFTPEQKKEVDDGAIITIRTNIRGYKTVTKNYTIPAEIKFFTFDLYNGTTQIAPGNSSFDHSLGFSIKTSISNYAYTDYYETTFAVNGSTCTVKKKISEIITGNDIINTGGNAIFLALANNEYSMTVKVVIAGYETKTQIYNRTLKTCDFKVYLGSDMVNNALNKVTTFEEDSSTLPGITIVPNVPYNNDTDYYDVSGGASNCKFIGSGMTTLNISSAYVGPHSIVLTVYIKGYKPVSHTLSWTVTQAKPKTFAVATDLVETNYYPQYRTGDSFSIWPINMPGGYNANNTSTNYFIYNGTKYPYNSGVKAVRVPIDTSRVGSNSVQVTCYYEGYQSVTQTFYYTVKAAEVPPQPQGWDVDCMMPSNIRYNTEAFAVPSLVGGQFNSQSYYSSIDSAGRTYERMPLNMNMPISLSTHIYGPGSITITICKDGIETKSKTFYYTVG